uniref:Vps16 C-terminal domain-containing protein n=1 Tax=Parascaris equorum TaxID=6256 RepID=A0A914RPK8_PAREQ
MNFLDVAMKAVDAGLSPLGELLLEKETRLSRQIDMLLKLNKVDKALAKAACSHQPDLCMLFLMLHLFCWPSVLAGKLMLAYATFVNISIEDPFY